MFTIHPGKDRGSSNEVAQLDGVETATLGHILASGFMAPQIQCALADGRVCGPAMTVSVPEDDGTVLAHAVSMAKRGDVLVVDRMGDERHACWGAVMTAAAKYAGVAGVVIDGYITDIAAVRASGLPVWSKGRSPLTTKLKGNGGGINIEIQCGGARVRPGDIVLADESGVCVIAPQDACRLGQEARRLQDGEPGVIARIQAGERLDDINGARALIANALQER